MRDRMELMYANALTPQTTHHFQAPPTIIIANFSRARVPTCGLASDPGPYFHSTIIGHARLPCIINDQPPRKNRNRTQETRYGRPRVEACASLRPFTAAAPTVVSGPESSVVVARNCSVLSLGQRLAEYRATSPAVDREQRFASERR